MVTSDPNPITYTSTLNNEADKIEWTKLMRAKFSPQGMLNGDLTINQDFFKPTKVVIVSEKKWGDAERDLLYKGLEKYGVGKWREISGEYLPAWDEQTLRIKSARLLGSQSLARYVGWKGDRGAVDAECVRNREIGARTGCWKAGVLVEDDNGSVRKALEEMAAAEAANA